MKSTSPTDLAGPPNPEEEPTKVFDADIPRAAMTISEYLAGKGLRGGVSLDGSSTSGVARLKADQNRKYEMGRLVAQGGMGAILDAKDCCVRRHVAMKVMLARHQLTNDRILRFIEEAQITGQLEHPNIVPVHELGVDSNGNVFYTMKYVRGRTLLEILNGLRARDAALLKEFTLPRLLTLFLKICDAMAFAHSKGVLHRDLKPANIMVGDFGEVLVMDWGLAKVLRQSRAEDAGTACVETPDAPPSRSIDGIRAEDITGSAATLAGAVMGTPQYMSPEQARGEGDTVHEQSDIYSLGAILYEMLTLQRAIQGENVVALLKATLAGRIAHPLTHRDTPWRIPPALAAVAMRALATRPEDRYPRVAALQAEIEGHLAGYATAAEHAGFLRLLWLAVKRHRMAATVCLSLLLGAFAILGGMFLASRAETARALTEQHRVQAAAEAARAKLALIEEEQRRRDAWIPVWEADFARGDPLDPRLELAIELQPLRGAGTRPPLPHEKVQVEDGVLVFPPGVESTLSWLEPLGDDHRIEVDIVWHRQDRNYRFSVGGTFYNGYRLCVFPMGGAFQLESFFAGYYQELDRRPVGASAEGAVARIVFEKRGQHLRLWRDGRLLIEYFEPLMPRGSRHQLFSLNATGNHGLRNDVRAIRVFRLRAPELVPVTEPARLLVQDGHFEQALNYLGGLLATQVAPAIVAESEYLRWRCLTALARPEADAVAEELIGRFPDSPYRWEVERASVLQLADQGEWHQAALRLERFPAASPVPVLRQAILARIVKHLQQATLDDDSSQRINEALRALKVEELTLHNCALADLRFLRGLGLRRLRLGHSVQLASLEDLRGMPLEALFVNSSRIADLSPLRGMPLQVLMAESCSVTDLSPLRGMPLTSLGVGECPVADLSPLTGMKLEHLNVSRCNGVASLAPLAGMPLRSLRASCNRLTDLAPLAGMPLENLEIGANSVADLSPLAKTHLRRLSAFQNRIETLEPLRGLPIEVLDLSSNRIRDLSPLAGMPLALLAVADNPLTSLAPFLDQPPPQFYFACDSLPDHELERAIAAWSTRDEWAPLAAQARLLLTWRHEGAMALRRFAAEHKGHRYLLVPVMATWDEAARLATEAGAHLVTLTSEDEDRFVAGLLPPSPLTAWLGLTHEPDRLAWHNGEPFAYSRMAPTPPLHGRNCGIFGFGNSMWIWSAGTAKQMPVLEWDDDSR